MKTKLILASFLAFGSILNAQVWDVVPNGNSQTGVTSRRGHVGIFAPTPAYPLHVIQNNTAAGSAQSAGYFDYTATQNGNHAALVGIANDAGGCSGNYKATELIGVQGEAYNGYNNYGGAFAAGNCWGNPSSNWVTIGMYAKLDPTSGANSAQICAGIYGDDWSTGGTGGNGPTGNWGGFFVGDVVTTTNYYIYSDRKIKTNVQPLRNALDKVMLLKPSTYDYKTEEYPGLSLTKRPQMGLIAQEVEVVFPDLVKETGIPGRNEKGNVIATGETAKTVNYVNLIPVLIAAMQEQQKQIDEQKIQIAELMKSSNSTGLTPAGNGAMGFEMYQNEPNPFNGETTVKYNLPENFKNAHMIVYDLSGKQVASFPITEKGSSSITLTSENLSAGIYIYSIIADNKILDSKRMVVAQK